MIKQANSFIKALNKGPNIEKVTGNEHVLERHAAAVRQLTNGDDLYIHIATVGNTIQTVNSPMCEYTHEYSW